MGWRTQGRGGLCFNEPERRAGRAGAQAIDRMQQDLDIDLRARAVHGTRPRPGEGEALRHAYDAVRAHSARLTEGLTAEDQALQSMPDCSPVKWHLAHSSWFFETLVLRPHAPGYREHDARFRVLFNSYYESLGERHPRPQRGLLSRPTLEEVWRYRHHVDAGVRALLASEEAAAVARAAPLLTLGLHHEQQHQELILTDLKHAFSLNPLGPAYRPGPPARPGEAPPLHWLAGPEGRVEVGHDGRGFAFDNEAPRHAVLLAPFQIASRPVNCGEYLAFIRDGGYRDPALWLSDGWACVQAEGWSAPAYWRLEADGRAAELFTLHGWRPLDPSEPVCHLSYYEAAAYAEWVGARLPSEFEWEAAFAAHGGGWPAAPAPPAVHPSAGRASDGGAWQQAGQVWEWTRSAYAPYPGFRPLQGAASEYNGKFMVNQMVLRGGSCASPPGHLRASYRNFFPPAARWQFSGLRLARDPA